MSDLPARLQIVTPLGMPTRAFQRLWAGSGALLGLPAILVLVTPEGRPTAEFFRLFRSAFPASDLSARDLIVADQQPTRRFLALWSQSTA